MKNKNREAIEGIFARFVQAWKERDASVTDRDFLPGAICEVSAVGTEVQGPACVARLFATTPQAAFVRMDPANSALLLRGREARHSVYLLADLLTGEPEPRGFSFQAICAFRYAQTEAGWKIASARIAICDPHGTGLEAPDWQHERRIGWYEDTRLPVIEGELDSPWRIGQAEPPEDQTEAVMLPFYRYAFGLDTLSFGEIDAALHPSLQVDMAPYGHMNKRQFLATLKTQRQTGIDWVHPAKLYALRMEEDRAYLTLYRVGGHDRRPIPVTRENITQQYTDGRYELTVLRTEAGWQIAQMRYTYAPTLLEPWNTPRL